MLNFRTFLVELPQYGMDSDYDDIHDESRQMKRYSQNNVFGGVPEVVKNYIYNNDTVNRPSNEDGKLKDFIDKNGKPLEHDVHVFHGTSGHLRIKGVFKPSRFLSTSIDPNVAKDFASYPADKSSFDRLPKHAPKTILHIVLPKGFKNGTYVDENKYEEREYIINHGQEFEHLGTELHDDEDHGPILIHHLRPKQ